MGICQSPAIHGGESALHGVDDEGEMMMVMPGPGRRTQTGHTLSSLGELLPSCLIPGFNGAIFSVEWKEALWDKFYTHGMDPRCLIPGFNGAIFSVEWKEALWDKFYTAAPRRQRQPVEQYKIVKRA
ncbi:hypothetical protein X742_27195 [Mesorhizobium sp. LNHC232B00]|nr:hypothetical protein X742_27195 [Mesorhizobium sp. LNHC232B00]